MYDTEDMPAKKPSMIVIRAGTFFIIVSTRRSRRSRSTPMVEPELVAKCMAKPTNDTRKSKQFHLPCVRHTHALASLRRTRPDGPGTGRPMKKCCGLAPWAAMLTTHSKQKSHTTTLSSVTMNGYSSAALSTSVCRATEKAAKTMSRMEKAAHVCVSVTLRRSHSPHPSIWSAMLSSSDDSCSAASPRASRSSARRCLAASSASSPFSIAAILRNSSLWWVSDVCSAVRWARR